jgi:hypothetical protein
MSVVTAKVSCAGQPLRSAHRQRRGGCAAQHHAAKGQPSIAARGQRAVKKPL